MAMYGSDQHTSDESCIANNVNSTEPIETRIVVATFNSEGDPDLMFVKVQATEDEIEKGYHYVCAKRYVVENLDGDWDSPMVCYDCHRDIAGEGLESMFEWDSFTDVVNVTLKDVNGETD